VHTVDGGERRKRIRGGAVRKTWMIWHHTLYYAIYAYLRCLMGMARTSDASDVVHTGRAEGKRPDPAQPAEWLNSREWLPYATPAGI
jgi:hypothetical protein